MNDIAEKTAEAKAVLAVHTETNENSEANTAVLAAHDDDERDDDGDAKPAAGLDASNLPNYDDAETKRVLRKVDYRLVPMLVLLYLICFVDKGNIGNAKVAGMNKDLKLTGSQYNIALMVGLVPPKKMEKENSERVS
jgi:hypothetical protein